ncbi:glycosyltransferase [Parvularcula sp. ZS-1/3]|uniref:Glycosyltransferase n=1 Tax=Parvularcula mediterranea TaxID=2732508 RepID=A0A7Y3W426_9PROT|nr:TIGR04282 family arsenosugar biosynthesis glycosyltransferase [Parvularcula mediterranea]NNU14751.1 glycosyltransferase [Parvularcula mediterranea]
MTARIVILARFPVAGQCKTRLIPALGPEGAAEMHRKLAELTVARVRESGLPFTLWGTGADEDAFTEWLGPLDFQEQPAGDLGERLALASDPAPVIFLGTDCPDLSPSSLRKAGMASAEGRYAIGPAHDGGYWTLAIPEKADWLFTDMPWGTERVYGETVERMKAKGIEPEVLETLHDVDRPEDLERWPDLTQ